LLDAGMALLEMAILQGGGWSQGCLGESHQWVSALHCRLISMVLMVGCDRLLSSPLKPRSPLILAFKTAIAFNYILR